jgi:signal transduction histidine kinase
MMAHEVRNPLGVLFNSISSLQRIIKRAQATAPLPDADRLLGIAKEEAERLNHIVGDLLDFANPNPPRFELASLPSVVADVTVQAAAHPALAEVTLRTEIQPGLPLVEMDRRWLHQALFNIVVNALEAMPGEGALVLRARPAGDAAAPHAEVEIIDTGPGIPHDLAERIFEPFFTTKSFGTGLGLAVVRRIVEAHHGQVAVSSAAGRTTLTLRLPVRQTPRAEQALPLAG